jgi:hypothetical protein
MLSLFVPHGSADGTFLDRCRKSADNCCMELPGRVQHGVVVFDGGADLPEGTRVIVHAAEPDRDTPRERKRVQLPLVTGGEPGSLDLTNEHIYKILDEEDVASLKGIGDVPS